MSNRLRYFEVLPVQLDETAVLWRDVPYGVIVYRDIPGDCIAGRKGEYGEFYPTDGSPALALEEDDEVWRMQI